jgi:hypothetical protein
LDPRVDVTPNLDRFEIWTERAEQSHTALRAGAHAGAGWQFGERATARRDQHVPRISSLRYGGDQQARNWLTGYVLERVDGHVCASSQQGILDTLDEDATASEDTERCLPIEVALGINLDNLDLQAWVGYLQRLCHKFNLHECEL